MTNKNEIEALPRKVDELGRIVLPIELRRRAGIELRSAISISFCDGAILLKPYQPQCIHCHSTGDDEQPLELINVEKQLICAACLEKYARRFDEIHDANTAE